MYFHYQSVDYKVNNFIEMSTTERTVSRAGRFKISIDRRLKLFTLTKLSVGLLSDMKTQVGNTLHQVAQDRLDCKKLK